MMRSPPLPLTSDLSTELTNTREWADGVVTRMDLVRMKGALLGKSNIVLIFLKQHFGSTEMLFFVPDWS